MFKSLSTIYHILTEMIDLKRLHDSIGHLHYFLFLNRSYMLRACLREKKHGPVARLSDLLQIL